MKRKNTCGHKAGPDCIICNDPADTDMARHLACVYKLLDIAPQLIAAQMLEPNGETAVAMFTNALGYTPEVQPEPEIIDRLCKLVIAATNVTGQMIRIVDPREHIPLEAHPQWDHKHLISARMLIAAANEDAAMVADLLVAALAGLDPGGQLDILSSVLFLQTAAGWKVREVLKAKAAKI